MIAAVLLQCSAALCGCAAFNSIQHASASDSGILVRCYSDCAAVRLSLSLSHVSLPPLSLSVSLTDTLSDSV